MVCFMPKQQILLLLSVLPITAKHLCGISFCWEQCFDYLLWFHTVWNTADCNLHLTASSRLVRFPAKQLLETSDNECFLSQSEGKNFATLDCKINGSHITFYESVPRFFTWILSLYSPDSKGDVLACVLYCCMLSCWHIFSWFCLIVIAYLLCFLATCCDFFYLITERFNGFQEHCCS